MDIDNSTDTITPDGSATNEPLRLGGVGGIQVGSGTTSQRFAGTPAIIRHNTDTVQLETSGPNGDCWAPILDGSNMAIGSSFLYDTDTTASAPADGYIKFNSTTLASITNILVNQLTPAGLNAAMMLSMLKIGDRVVIQEKNDTWRMMAITITSLPVNLVTYFSIGCSVDFSYASFTAPGDLTFTPYLQSRQDEISNLILNTQGFLAIDFGGLNDYYMTQEESQYGAIVIFNTGTGPCNLTFYDSVDNPSVYEISICNDYDVIIHACSETFVQRASANRACRLFYGFGSGAAFFIESDLNNAKVSAPIVSSDVIAENDRAGDALWQLQNQITLINGVTLGKAVATAAGLNLQ